MEEVTKYHCTVLKEYNKDNWTVFLDPEREGYEKAVNFVNSKQLNVEILDYAQLANWLTTTPKAIAMHNFFGYDLRLWRKLSGIQFDMFRDPGCRGTLNNKQVDLFDTLSMSRLLYPDRPLPPGCPAKIPCPVTGKMKTVGPHGLEAWGMRVGNKKPKIDDWRDQPLWVYVDRCIEDVIINERVWSELILESQGRKEPGDIDFFYKEKAEGFKQINWKNGLRRGMLADFLMCEQEDQGVCFKREDAQKLVVRIDGMMKEIADEIEPKLPLKEMSKSEQPKFPQKPFKEGNGEISSTGWNWLEKQLNYPVNREALEITSPPKTAFKQGSGELSVAGKNYCIKHGVEDESLMPDFIRSQLNKVNTLKPLPDDLMEKAIKDLQNQVMPDIMVPMKLGNQDDIKKFLIRDAGWQPTIWRAKDVTKDSNKKQRPDSEVDEKVREYLTDLDQSEYRDLILRYLGITWKQFQNKEKMYKFLRRKARQLPTSPQLKDQRGALCPNLEQVDGELAKGIVKWLSLRNRRSVLDPIDEDKNDTGLLNHPRLDIDGKLPARANGRTNTHRMKHSIIANFPKPDEKVLLGKEMRDLCTVPEGKYQVGIDGSNLEQLIAAWAAYDFDQGLYYDVVSNGDSHTNNALAYSQVAGREVKRGEGKNVTYACLPVDNTMVLTRSGWKYYDELYVGQEVLTHNKEKGYNEWNKIEAIHFYEEAKVDKIENSHFTFEATSDHRWFGKRRTGRGLTKRYVEEFFKTQDIKSEHNILRVAETFDTPILDITDAQAGVLAWLATDGYWKWSEISQGPSTSHGKKRGFIARICQTENKYAEDIRNDLKTAGIGFTEFKAGERSVVDFLLKADDVRKLIDSLPFGRLSKHDYPWEDLVLGLSPSARKYYLETCWKAEGWTTKGVKILCQNEGKILESIRLATYLSGSVPQQNDHGAEGVNGFKSNGTCKNLTISPRKYVSGQRLKINHSRVADVFCLTTANSTFVARQGNHITITGNCLYGAGAAKISIMLGIDTEKGQAVIDALWDSNPGLKARKEWLEKFWEATGKRFIPGLDGRLLWARSKSSLLNLYFQNGGSSLMDLAGLLLHRELINKGWYDDGVRRIIYYHDEFQLEVPEKYKEVRYYTSLEEAQRYVTLEIKAGKVFEGHTVKEGKVICEADSQGRYMVSYCPVGEMVVRSIEKAAKVMKAPVFITGEYLCGYSWGGCH